MEESLPKRLRHRLSWPYLPTQIGARSATSHALIFPMATDKRMQKNHQPVMRSRKFDQELISDRSAIDQHDMKSMTCEVRGEVR